MSARPSLILAILLLPLSAQGEELSLRQAVQEAMSGNLGLLVARYDALLSQDQAALAAAGYEPRLSASVQRSTDFIRSSADLVDLGVPFASTVASIGVSQPLPGGGSASLTYGAVLFDDKSSQNPYRDTPSLRFSLRQPLLSGAILGSRERAVADSRFALGDAALALEAAVQDLVLEVEDAYWALVQASQAVRAADLSLEGASHQQGWIQERVDLGFDAPAELLATQERVASAEAAQSLARAARADAEARLLYLLGRDLRAPREGLGPTTAPSAFEVPEVEEAEAQALEQNLAVQQGRRAVLTARRALRFTVMEQLPSLDATVSVGPDLNPEQVPWTAGLGLSAPLPGLGRIHAMLAARAQVRQVEARLQDIEQRLRLQVESSSRAVATAGVQVELAEVGLDVAQRKLDAEGERLSRGRSTNKTVLDYLEDRDQAVRGRDDARVGLARAAAQLRRLTGGSLGFWGIDPEALMERREELR